MINKIGFKNYKAFKEADIELKPITILLGSNSVGKSSIIKLLLMISQNINSNIVPKNILSINGEVVQFGSFENLLHKRNLQHSLEISFDLENINFDIYFNDLKNKINVIVRNLKKTYFLCTKGLNNYQEYFNEIDREEREENINNLLNTLNSYKLRINNISKRETKVENQNNLIAKFISIYFDQNEENIYSFFQKKDGLLYFDTKVLRHTYDFLSNLSKHQSKNIKLIYSFKLSKNKKDIKIVNFELKSEEDILFKYEKDSLKNKISSIYIEDNIAKLYASKFNKLVSLNQFQVFKILRTEDNFFIDTLIKIFQNISKQIHSSFSYENINYVDPLRAYPRRYYFLDEINNTSALNKIDGESMAKILKENAPLKRSVNKWIQKFNLRVNIEQLKDTIHNIKINQNSLSLDITDVGFGISQILPIITQGFFAKNGSTTIIEQPEIHLHPKMQADLADLFIEMTNDKNKKKFLIETHSEYMLKRLRRRIAEGKISNDDVAIYSLSYDNDNSRAEIEKIGISESGAFNWPKDFLDTELEDTIEFMKLQG
ncbi:AAA family ATPase [Arcobacter defluvii]|uniref:Endonuclease GajA/Old nuclease/RecF-like AAA domain-containing protein n=1 Tax=Arcobacter defluvii TaxID=873191 RepID=A0AAE7BAX6_9BACT|nr:AAA family ATPase [Arcobacter defluvii]QKF76135.1 hypothetical protein ADFLV_0063 [Arcobacter defluvii]RXI32291.1 hypothetical protein CP964_08435 [Arcobacter defluvii]